MVDEVESEGGSSVEEDFFADIFDVSVPLDVVWATPLGRNWLAALVAEVLLEKWALEIPSKRIITI